MPNNKRKVNYYWGKSICFYDGIFDLSTILNFQIPMKRKRGMKPNRYWYQLNGQSAQANWLEQREAIYSRIQEQEEEVVPQIVFTSEVKIK